MPQQQCPWCGHCGPRYVEGTPISDRPRAHSDGSECVCRHVTCQTRLGALDAGGRYWAGSSWLCVRCGTAPPATEHEITRLVAAWRQDRREFLLGVGLSEGESDYLISLEEDGYADAISAQEAS